MIGPTISQIPRMLSMLLEKLENTTTYASNDTAIEAKRELVKKLKACSNEMQNIAESAEVKIDDEEEMAKYFIEMMSKLSASRKPK